MRWQMFLVKCHVVAGELTWYLQLPLGTWETSALAGGDITFQDVTMAFCCEAWFILEESENRVKTPDRIISTFEILHIEN